MNITENNWSRITKIVYESMKSSMCCGLGTVGADGMPHVTPIGSLVFTEVGKGFYFEQLPVKTPENIRHNSELCFMAVNSSRRYWLKFFFTGQFHSLPGIRLYGTAGKKRTATEQEKNLWQNKVKGFKLFKGYDVLWKDLSRGREVQFHSFAPVLCGKATEKAAASLMP